MMEVAAVGAAASLSLADVNYDNVGKRDGSQCTFMGLLTLLLVGTSREFIRKGAMYQNFFSYHSLFSLN
jgi:hypothetical protein